MEIYNALQLKEGARTKQVRMFSITQPLQFLPKKDKDHEWSAWNMDWLEWQGLKQIRRNARKMLKAYKLADGIIDKSDYIIEDNNEMRGLVEELSSSEEVAALELKFYPIIPNMVNTLLSEFAKRDKRVSFRALDSYTHNEILDRKASEIENVLVRNAERKFLENLIAQGLDPQDPEVQQMMQQQMSPEAMRSLPEIQEFYSKHYEVISEKWASKQYYVDSERFHMDELEEIAFKDKLVTDREFWHFLMYEDDYEIELWNPITTFYHKSPKERYISNCNFIGNIEVMTPADVIDHYGWKMNEEQLLALQNRYLIDTPGYALGGLQNDGSFYDATKSHDWNVNRPSLEYRQMMAGNNFIKSGNDIIAQIMRESEDEEFFTNANMIRVTTCYWKSQVRIGYLTKISDNGEVITQTVSEDYKITDKPIYNTSLIKNKTTRNLVFGEHIEWIWINQTWGGLKIGPNAPTMYGTQNALGLEPIYIGIDQNEIKPLRFQFKGDNNEYGCKVPVEGRVFNDRNVKSSSFVDSLKPFQIGYNMVNNQIADILIDEIGSVIVLDQNALPKHSLGEDWGKNNYAKALTVMKDFSVLPLDTTINNTENALNFQHFQKLDMSQTERLMSRVQLANYFKQQAYEQVGISPQRVGQQIGARVTATEVEQIQVGSYAQTEKHFIEHCDQLMPRVHQMRTDLAQWYNSTKPSVQLQLTTSLDERINFEINGEDLMLRDIHVYCSTKANYRKILEQMKQLAVNNNTTGASIYDLGNILQADTLGSLDSILKQAEAKMQQQRQEQMQHEQQMQQQELEQRNNEKMLELDRNALEKEKDRRRDILVAEIRSAGYGAMQDINQNNQSDFMDTMEQLRQSQEYQETVNIQRDKLAQQQVQHEDKMNLKREELLLKERMKQQDVSIAEMNKNKYDVKQPQNTKNEKK